MPSVLSLFAGIGGFDLGLGRAGFTVAGQIEIDPFCQRVLAARWPGVGRAEDVRTWKPRGDSGRGPDESLAREWRAGGDERERGTGLLAPEREDTVGSLDLLVGGFPCQDLSVAGKRAGLGGERSGLFWEIVRIAKITRPTWGLFENVPGLLSSHRGSDMALVIAGLRECWPVVGWRILDSRYFGVAQRRRRVFFVCGPTETGVAQVLALTEGGAGDPEAGGEAGAVIAHAVSAGAGGSKFGSGRDGQDDFVVAPTMNSYQGRNQAEGQYTVGQCHGNNVGPMGALRKGDGGVTSGVPFVAETLSAGSNPHSNMAGRRREDDVNLVFEPKASAHQSMNPNQLAPALGTSKEPAVFTHALTGEGHDAGEDGTGRGTPIVAFDTTQITSDKNYSNPQPGDPCHPLAGGMHPPAIAYTVHAQNANVKVRHAFEDDQSRTLDGMSGPDKNQGGTAILSASSVRRLTPLECERLQGFPDGWTCLCQPLEAYAQDPDSAALACTCPDSPRYRALGNAVTVSVVSWIGQRLRRYGP